MTPGECIWCYRSYGECGVDAAGGLNTLCTEWLAVAEKRHAWRFRSPLRLRSWVAGRIAAKRVLARQNLVSGAPPQEITIVSRDAQGRGIAPRVHVGGRELKLNLSISHSERGVLIGVSRNQSERLGVDLVPRITMGRGFCRLWFTSDEQAFVQRNSAADRFAAAAIWAAKEAVFKTLDDGRPFEPRQIEILPASDGPWACRVRGQDMHETCHIRHWIIDGQTACLAVRRIPSGEPLQAQFTSHQLNESGQST